MLSSTMYFNYNEKNRSSIIFPGEILHFQSHPTLFSFLYTQTYRRDNPSRKNSTTPSDTQRLKLNSSRD